MSPISLVYDKVSRGRAAVADSLNAGEDDGPGLLNDGCGELDVLADSLKAGEGNGPGLLNDGCGELDVLSNRDSEQSKPVILHPSGAAMIVADKIMSSGDSQ